MAEFEITLPDLLKQVFGIDGYLPSLPGQDEENPNDGIVAKYQSPIKVFELDSASEKSIFGTPIYDVIEFKDGDTTKLKLSDAPLVTLNRAKKIVQTPLQGEDDDVIEIISNSNWKISVKGLLVNSDSRKKPFDKYQSLLAMLNENVSQKVVSRLFAKSGITDLVITDWDFPPLEGYTNVIPYVFNAISDKPRELKLRE